MSAKKYGTAVIGAGHAGLLVSYYLTLAGQDHVVLERGEIGERWRRERWDSMSLITPNFQVELPGLALNQDPDGFLSKQQFIDYLDDYASSFGAPVLTNSEVRLVEAIQPQGFRLQTSEEVLEADSVVVATGPFQKPWVPDFASRLPASVLQIHATEYKNPRAVPDGAVLVVGSGNSGTQIAREMVTSGRRTFLSVGRHKHTPRWYRGRSSSRWSQAMGTLDTTLDKATADAIEYVASAGISVRSLAESGVTLLGPVQSIHEGVIDLDSSLKAILEASDAAEQAYRRRIDRFIDENGIDAPLDEDRTEAVAPSPSLNQLLLADQGIGTVIWATGYRADYSWLKAASFDEEGKPVHVRGVTEWPGLYFVGLRWLHKAKSFVIYGVAEDAAYIADHIRENARRSKEPINVRLD